MVVEFGEEEGDGGEEGDDGEEERAGGLEPAYSEDVVYVDGDGEVGEGREGDGDGCVAVAFMACSGGWVSGKVPMPSAGADTSFSESKARGVSSSSDTAMINDSGKSVSDNIHHE